MAFATTRSFQETLFATDTTSWAITLPPTVNNGDLLVVGIAMDGAQATTWDNSSFGTWTQIVDFNRAGGSPTLVIYAKVADGTEDAGTLTPTTSVVERGSAFAIAIQDWHGTIGGIEADATNATGNSAAPNSASLTPSWGLDDTVWFSIFSHDGIKTVSAYPASYTDNQHSGSAGGGSGASYGLASRENATTTEDPAAYTTSASSTWVATTLAIRPAAAPPTGSGSPTTPMPTSTGTGNIINAISGSGSTTIPILTSIGEGNVSGGPAPDVYSIGGVPNLDLPLTTALGSSGFNPDVVGSGSGSTPNPTMTGVSVAGMIGSGSFATPLPVVSGSGLSVVAIIGSGSMILPPPTANGSNQLSGTNNLGGSGFGWASLAR